MSPKALNTFEKIFVIVSKIPYGRVASYGEIADMVPIPSARIVGFALASLKESQVNIPWHRVVNHEGKISLRRLDLMLVQKKLLLSEGIQFNEKWRIDLRVYSW
jgi:methylated-DNA-protein-cysteine methyltransferase-like protein